MNEEEEAIGCPCPLKKLAEKAELLSAKVEETVNGTQELVLVNQLAKELNESLIKKCLQDRISDIASWKWVFEDLSQRLRDSVRALEYESKAIRVIIQRIKDQIYEQTRKGNRSLSNIPVDDVETNIKKELDFLRAQKKNFENFIPEIECEIAHLNKTRSRIKHDMVNKMETLAVEESCANFDLKSYTPNKSRTKIKKRRSSSLTNWENRCMSLKRDGLKALCKGVLIRQKIRGARVQLTLESQAAANKVDSALRKRLHANEVKLQEIDWQREEIKRDLQALEEEQLQTEQSLIANIDQERAVELRLKDRSFRPSGELTRDEVDSNLRAELGRVRCFIKELNNNLNRITNLQNHLKNVLIKTDCLADDIYQVLEVDRQRAALRFGCCEQEYVVASSSGSSSQKNAAKLITIREEDEDDGFPYPD